jgi:hypothetical protein
MDDYVDDAAGAGGPLAEAMSFTQQGFDDQRGMKRAASSMMAEEPMLTQGYHHRELPPTPDLSTGCQEPSTPLYFPDPVGDSLDDNQSVWGAQWGTDLDCSMGPMGMGMGHMGTMGGGEAAVAEGAQGEGGSFASETFPSSMSFESFDASSGLGSFGGPQRPHPVEPDARGMRMRRVPISPANAESDQGEDVEEQAEPEAVEQQHSFLGMEMEEVAMEMEDLDQAQGEGEVKQHWSWTMQQQQQQQQSEAPAPEHYWSHGNLGEEQHCHFHGVPHPSPPPFSYGV